MIDLNTCDAVSFARELERRYAREVFDMVEFLLALVEFDRRRLYLDLGYASLWKYCLDGLHLGEGATSLRTRAVHVLQRHPVLVEFLRDRRLTLSTLCTLAPVLTAENAIELATAATHKTKEQVEELVVAIRPRQVPQDGLRMLPLPCAPEPPAERPVEESTIVSERPPRRDVRPSAARKWLLTVEMSAPTREKYRRARELAASTAGNDLDAFLAEVFGVYIEKVEKRVFKKTERPRTAKVTDPSGAIPADVKRTVASRDEYQCTQVGADGHRCEEKRNLHFDHILPRALGGLSTVENLRLLCAAHNQHAADRIFGREFMERHRGHTSQDV